MRMGIVRQTRIDLMKQLPISRVSNWLLAHRIVKDPSLEQAITELKMAGKCYACPQDALTSYDFCRFLSAHFAGGERLLLQTENSIFTGDDELSLYTTYVTQAIDFDSEIDKCALIFETKDDRYFVNILSMNIMFKWDCLLGAVNTQSLLLFSHDGLFWLLSNDVDLLRALGDLGFLPR